jgi:hypothetical protein
VVVALLVVKSLNLLQRSWLQQENSVTIWWRGVRSAAGDDIHGMHGWLAIGPRCIAMAVAYVFTADTCSARSRSRRGLAVRRGVLPGDVVPGAQGIVAWQSGVVPFFLLS